MYDCRGSFCDHPVDFILRQINVARTTFPSMRLLFMTASEDLVIIASKLTNHFDIQTLHCVFGVGRG